MSELFYYTGDAILKGSLTVQSKKPLDSRLVVEHNSDLLRIPPTIAYTGMPVVVLEDNTFWILSDINKITTNGWIKICNINDLSEVLDDYYTKQEVDRLIQIIPTFDIAVVEELPTENISETTIYLLKGDGDILFTEYIYNNNQWVSLGEQRVDLQGYATLENLNTLETTLREEINNSKLISGVNIKTVGGQSLLDMSTGTDIPLPTSDLDKEDLNLALDNLKTQINQKIATDLLNYYTKDQTYDRSEINNLISSISNFEFKVVSVLPDASANTLGKIYLVDSGSSYKDEYITVGNNGGYQWELIGNTSINLSNYYTATQTDLQIENALQKYLTQEELTDLYNSIINNALENYYNKTVIEQKIKDIVKADTLLNYYTKEEVNKLIEIIPTFDIKVVDILPTENISPTTIYLVKDTDGTSLFTEYIYNEGQWVNLGKQTINFDGYITTEDLEQALSIYAKSSDIENLVDKEVFNEYKTSVALAINDFVTSSEVLRAINTTLTNYYTKDETYSKQEINSMISPIQFQVEIIENFPTNPNGHTIYLKEEQDESYTEYLYINNQWVSIGKFELDLSGYLKISDADAKYALLSSIDSINTELAKKQNILISGENIKSINGESILGKGNIIINTSGLSPEDLSEITDQIQSVDNKFGNYYTKNQTYNRDEIDSKVAGILRLEVKVVEELPLVGEYNIIYLTKQSEDSLYYTQYIYSDNEWKNLGNLTLNLSAYALQEDLENLETRVNNKQDKLVNKVNIKSVNEQSLLGSGNVNIKSSEIDPEILSTFLTKEEYYNEKYPLKASLSANITLKELNGESTDVTLNYSISQKEAIVPDTLILKVGNTTHTLTPASSGTFIAENISNTTNYVLTATKNGKTASSSASTTFVKPTYYGFDSSETSPTLSNLIKEVKTTISTTKTLNNTVAGNYLWIVSPFNLNTVATDAGFTYVVSMERIKQEDNLNFYRSTLAIDVCNLTYYIK